MKILLITGGRNNVDYYAFCQAVESLPFKPDAILHGGANGTDSHADMYSKINCIPVMRMDALWKTQGKAAGNIRNANMLKFIDVHACLAMQGGTGTNDMVKQCRKCNVPVYGPFLEVGTL